MNLTSLLTLIAMFDGVRSEVPKVSSISFLDIWITVCVIIIFLAIAEYSVSHSLCRAKQKNKAILLDTVSRYAIIILFAVFNIIYWPLLLQICVKSDFCEIENQHLLNSTTKIKVF